jgi:N4-gp56 family major capsid protein
MTLTGTAQIPAGVANYYDKVLLARAQPELIHGQFGQQRPLPSKSSETIKFRRYTNLAAATTPITEGVTPTGKSLSITDMTATVQQYGDFVTVTDKVTYVVEDQVLNESAKILGQQMGETMDALVRSALLSGASVAACSHGANGGSPTELTYDDIQDVVRTMLGQSAKMFTPAISGANKFGTAPVRKAFWAMGHTDLLRDLEGIDQFIHTANYPKEDGVAAGEWGSVGNSRWVLSPLGYVAAGVYTSFIVGEDSYALTPLKEGIAEMIFKGMGAGDDPLNQRSTQGWKTLFTARVVNDSWITQLTSTLGA